MGGLLGRALALSAVPGLGALGIDKETTMRKKLLWVAVPVLMPLALMTGASSAATPSCQPMYGPEYRDTFATRNDCIKEGDIELKAGVYDCYQCQAIAYNGGTGWALMGYYAQ
jgi:hypothetical protein